MFILSSVWSTLCVLSLPQWLLLVGLACLYMYRQYMAPFKKYSHLPQLAPHWFKGNRTFGSKNLRDTYMDVYKALEGHSFGIFWDGNIPGIYLRDLDLIKKVQVTDFDHFVDLHFHPPDYLEKVGNVFGLADMTGDPWRKMKRMATPPFSVPRLKKSLPAMNDAADKLIKFLKANAHKEHLDAVNFSRKFFMNNIASVVFGTDIDCYGEVENEFEKHGKTLISLLRFSFLEVFPNLAGFFKIKMYNPEAEKFFANLCKKIVKQRRSMNSGVNDVLGNLMNVADENPDMTEDMLYKTCIQFFADGYESASAAVSTLFYQLTIHPDVQERVQAEIDNVFENRDENDHVDEKDFNEMPYLDQVISEGLRLGCLPFTNRNCTKPYKIPGEDFVIPKNMKVYIPIAGLHYDPKYWESPTKFDPERFSAENKGNIDSVTYQPFGFGPRACLGQNLMRLETKVMLIQLLRNFSLRPFGDMPMEIVWDEEALIGPSSVNIKLESRL